jgi:hypothetical protein
MQVTQDIDYKSQIDEAIKRAKCKKAFYLYDETGNRQFLGVFSRKKAVEMKNFFRAKNLINRISESDIKTTEPDTVFDFNSNPIYS